MQCCDSLKTLENAVGATTWENAVARLERAYGCRICNKDEEKNEDAMLIHYECGHWFCSSCFSCSSSSSSLLKCPVCQVVIRSPSFVGSAKPFYPTLELENFSVPVSGVNEEERVAWKIVQRLQRLVNSSKELSGGTRKKKKRTVRGGTAQFSPNTKRRTSMSTASSTDASTSSPIQKHDADIFTNQRNSIRTTSSVASKATYQNERSPRLSDVDTTSKKFLKSQLANVTATAHSLALSPVSDKNAGDEDEDEDESSVDLLLPESQSRPNLDREPKEILRKKEDNLSPLHYRPQTRRLQRLASNSSQMASDKPSSFKVKEGRIDESMELLSQTTASEGYHCSPEEKNYSTTSDDSNLVVQKKEYFKKFGRSKIKLMKQQFTSSNSSNNGGNEIDLESRLNALHSHPSPIGASLELLPSNSPTSTKVYTALIQKNISTDNKDIIDNDSESTVASNNFFFASKNESMSASAYGDDNNVNSQDAVASPPPPKNQVHKPKSQMCSASKSVESGESSTVIFCGATTSASSSPNPGGKTAQPLSPSTHQRSLTAENHKRSPSTSTKKHSLSQSQVPETCSLPSPSILSVFNRNREPIIQETNNCGTNTCVNSQVSVVYGTVPQLEPHHESIEVVPETERQFSPCQHSERLHGQSQNHCENNDDDHNESQIIPETEAHMASQMTTPSPLSLMNEKHCRRKNNAVESSSDLPPFGSSIAGVEPVEQNTKKSPSYATKISSEGNNNVMRCSGHKIVRSDDNIFRKRRRRRPMFCLDFTSTKEMELSNRMQEDNICTFYCEIGYVQVPDGDDDRPGMQLPSHLITHSYVQPHPCPGKNGQRQGTTYVKLCVRTFEYLKALALGLHVVDFGWLHHAAKNYSAREGINFDAASSSIRDIWPSEEDYQIWGDVDMYRDILSNAENMKIDQNLRKVLECGVCNSSHCMAELVYSGKSSRMLGQFTIAVCGTGDNSDDDDDDDITVDEKDTSVCGDVTWDQWIPKENVTSDDFTSINEICAGLSTTTTSKTKNYGVNVDVPSLTMTCDQVYQLIKIWGAKAVMTCEKYDWSIDDNDYRIILVPDHLTNDDIEFIVDEYSDGGSILPSSAFVKEFHSEKVVLKKDEIGLVRYSWISNSIALCCLEPLEKYCCGIVSWN